MKIKRKLPDLANISMIQNSSLTTRQLLETSTILISHDNFTPVPHKTKGRAIPKTPRRLPPTPNRISTPSINSTSTMNRITEDITTSKPKYRKEGQNGLKELLETGRIGKTVQQYCLDKISYNELMTSIKKEEPRKRSRVPTKTKKRTLDGI